MIFKRTLKVFWLFASALSLIGCGKKEANKITICCEDGWSELKEKIDIIAEEMKIEITVKEDSNYYFPTWLASGENINLFINTTIIVDNIDDAKEMSNYNPDADKAEYKRYADVLNKDNQKWVEDHFSESFYSLMEDEDGMLGYPLYFENINNVHGKTIPAKKYYFAFVVNSRWFNSNLSLSHAVAKALSNSYL